MKIDILAVGKIKEKYLTDGINEYKKRISRFADINIIEVDDEKASDKLSLAEEEKVKEKEGQKLLSKIPNSAYVVALDLKGKEKTSPEMAEFLNDITLMGKSHIIFVIGGSLGLHKNILQRADYKICFSKFTFPHQLMRLILIEQVYRWFKILNNETYHK